MLPLASAAFSTRRIHALRSRAFARPWSSLTVIYAAFASSPSVSWMVSIRVLICIPVALARRTQTPGVPVAGEVADSAC